MTTSCPALASINDVISPAALAPITTIRMFPIRLATRCA